MTAGYHREEKKISNLKFGKILEKSDRTGISRIPFVWGLLLVLIFVFEQSQIGWSPHRAHSSVYPEFQYEPLVLASVLLAFIIVAWFRPFLGGLLIIISSLICFLGPFVFYLSIRFSSRGMFEWLPANENFPFILVPLGLAFMTMRVSDSIPDKKPRWYWIRWIPRIWLLLAIMLSLFFYLNTGERYAEDDVYHFAALMLLLSGSVTVLVGWFWPLFGGILFILCLGFISLSYDSLRYFSIFIYPFLYIPGLIWLIIGIMLARRGRLR